MCFPTHPSRKEIPLFCLMNVVYPGISGQLSVRVVWWWNPLFSALSEWQLAPPLPLLPETAAKYFLLAKYEEVYLSIHLYQNLAHYFYGQPSSCTKVCSLLGLWLFIFIKHTLQGACWEKNDREALYWVCPVSPSCIRACVPHPWSVAGVQRFTFSSCTTACDPSSCTNPTSPPNAGIYPQGSLSPAGQTSHPSLHQQLGFSWIFPWTVWPFISPAKWQPPLADSEDSPTPVPHACHLLLIPRSGQTQSLSQIMLLQGSAVQLIPFPVILSGCVGSGNSPTREGILQEDVQSHMLQLSWNAIIFVT